MMWLNTALIGRAKDYVMDSMLVGWRNDAEKLAISVRNIPIHRFYKRIYISNRQNWHISYSMLYAQNCLFYSTLGKCIDLLPGTCLHMKNVLSCKNRCVSELCKDTCNCKSPAKNSRIESEPRLGLPMSGNRFLVPAAPKIKKCKYEYLKFWSSKAKITCFWSLFI